MSTGSSKAYLPGSRSHIGGQKEAACFVQCTGPSDGGIEHEPSMAIVSETTRIAKSLENLCLIRDASFRSRCWFHYAPTASAATATLIRTFTQETPRESLCKLRRLSTKARASSALSVRRSASPSLASLRPKYTP